MLTPTEIFSQSTITHVMDQHILAKEKEPESLERLSRQELGISLIADDNRPS